MAGHAPHHGPSHGSGKSAAGVSVNFGIRMATWFFRVVLFGLLIRLKWAIFPSKGVTFAGMDSHSKGEKALKHIVNWGVKRKYMARPATKDPILLAQHIRADLIPHVTGNVIPIDKRRMKDKDTWDHIKSVLDSHRIPYVVI